MLTRALLLLLFATASSLADLNSLVLEELRAMPVGGGYGTSLDSHRALASSVTIQNNQLAIDPGKAQPAYCSGATYLVFLKVLQKLEQEGKIHLDSATREALLPRLRPDGTDTLPDGESLWGRWNANGPGSARLFYQLDLGRNFTSFSEARPGDFMKIFWTDAVGKKEKGHSVIFLGEEKVDGVDSVRFWSSNRPGGFGEKTVPREKIAHAIFSRLERPARMTAWPSLGASDPYLASLGTTESSFPEALKKSGLNK
ncbi:hypothetical protein BH09VER1_BH09VER1_04750 [soil metagenome]